MKPASVQRVGRLLALRQEDRRGRMPGRDVLGTVQRELGDRNAAQSERSVWLRPGESLLAPLEFGPLVERADGPLRVPNLVRPGSDRSRRARLLVSGSVSYVETPTEIRDRVRFGEAVPLLQEG